MTLIKMKLEKYVENFVWNIRSKNENKIIENKQNWKEIWKESFKDGIIIVKKILPYVIIGIAVGATIHGYVPAGYFENYIGKDNIFAVPLSVLIGIPMYADAAGIIPITNALVEKGVPIGTAIAFMMSVIGLSFPGFMILKKVMKIQLLLIFFGLIGFFMIILGYIFNIVL